MATLGSVRRKHDGSGSRRITTTGHMNISATRNDATARALSPDLLIFSIPPLLLSFPSLKRRVAAPLWPFVTLFKYVPSHTLVVTSLRRRALRADDEIWYIAGLRRWRLSETTVDHNGLGVTHLTCIQILIDSNLPPATASRNWIAFKSEDKSVRKAERYMLDQRCSILTKGLLIFLSCL